MICDNMNCVDIGSGYNPKEGYKTCDTNAYCDYYDVTEIEDNSIDIAHIRNVLHHVEDINSFIKLLKTKMKDDSIVDVIDCNEKNFKTNVFLDKLWYRYIFIRKDIYIHEIYRNFGDLFKQNGFLLLSEEEENEKVIFKFKVIK